MFIISNSSHYRISYEDYVARVKKVNPNIELISPFLGITKRIRSRCLIDGYEWEAEAKSLYKHHCPRCSGKERKTHERFLIELEQINPNIEVLSPYVRTMSKVKCKCKIDSNEFEMTPAHLLSGHGCPQCGGTKRLNTDVFKQRMAKIQPDIEVLGIYKNNKTNIALKCKVCGLEWEATPNALIKCNQPGTGCPHCNSSRGEKRIATYLKSHNIKYYLGHSLKGCKYIHHLPFDFYIPDLNTAVEYDGEQHFYCVDFSGDNPERAQNLFELVQKRDKIKDDYCSKNHIKLIRIPYTEFNNIEKILEERL